MPRIARFVWPGVPHHVTQRGNRRGRIFFSDSDCSTYLKWLREYASLHELEILAYCLMPNHVHLVAVPSQAHSLSEALRNLHARFAMHVNRSREWNGHVWQGRFFASALDEPYFWAAIRYVERNPLRAGMVKRAEDYRWSSAAAHCGLTKDPVLSEAKQWRPQFAGIGDWSAWLAAADETAQLERLRQYTNKGLPCGSDQFVAKLEQCSGRQLQYRSQGRDRSKGSKGDRAL